MDKQISFFFSGFGYVGSSLIFLKVLKLPINSYGRPTPIILSWLKKIKKNIK